MYLRRSAGQLIAQQKQLWRHTRSATGIARVARRAELSTTSYHLTDPDDVPQGDHLRGDVPRSRNGPLKIFTGRAHPELARQVAELLGQGVGSASTAAFKNGETNVEVHESVRDCDVFIVQPTCNPKPNQYFMELCFLIDAMRRSGASRITAVMPIFGYARQDKQDQRRAPISARLVCDMLAVAGANRVITIDLHAAQIQGFASFPMDNLYALPLIASYIRNTIGTDPKQIVVVAPDAGGAKRADIVAKILGCGLALCSKTRSKPNVVDSMRLVGEVEGKTAILVDDMADTMGTLCMAAELLKESGAKSVHAAVVHGVLSDPALDRLAESCLDQLVVTDTIPMSITLSDPRAAKLKVLPIAPMLAGAIQFVHKGLSLAALFRNDDPIKMAASIKWDSL